ncbi:uncharacterized protein PHALS_02488 [Plasmopara halstedii]|uniref:Uncharacterized protein n=1 Tax=Plasmopara halstedii TaxID=4781 RepID=A0A0P1A7W7_PLAHL|nr:uncharacterized protein PHALS_02488 [Plasmopara halstedii]CEG36386.1 hypothetical protein PHALS_02488 [Plasmopara halstedii]|eukprot:XP_024572755.1 hypothetical protein PHALS_02488 [Plasmopara halstedii]
MLRYGTEAGGIAELFDAWQKAEGWKKRSASTATSLGSDGCTGVTGCGHQDRKT